MDIVIIVPLYTAVQDGIGNGLDEVAVVVSAAQPLAAKLSADTMTTSVRWPR